MADLADGEVIFLWQGIIARHHTMIMVLKAQAFSLWGKGQIKPGKVGLQMYEMWFQGKSERDVSLRLSGRGQR